MVIDPTPSTKSGLPPQDDGQQPELVLVDEPGVRERADERQASPDDEFFALALPQARSMSSPSAQL